MTAFIVDAAVEPDGSSPLDLDRVWSVPQHAAKFVEIFFKFYSDVFFSDPEGPRPEALVALDPIRRRFGALPLVSLLCGRSKLPQVVWKEYGNLITGAPSVYGHDTHRDLVIVHDAIESGLTILRALADLHKQERTVLGVIAVEARSGETKEVIKMHYEKLTGRNSLVVETLVTGENALSAAIAQHRASTR